MQNSILNLVNNIYPVQSQKETRSRKNVQENSSFSNLVKNASDYKENDNVKEIKETNAYDKENDSINDVRIQEEKNISDKNSENITDDADKVNKSDKPEELIKDEEAEDEDALLYLLGFLKQDIDLSELKELTGSDNILLEKLSSKLSDSIIADLKKNLNKKIPDGMLEKLLNSLNSDIQTIIKQKFNKVLNTQFPKQSLNLEGTKEQILSSIKKTFEPHIDKNLLNEINGLVERNIKSQFKNFNIKEQIEHLVNKNLNNNIEKGKINPKQSETIAVQKENLNKNVSVSDKKVSEGNLQKNHEEKLLNEIVSKEDKDSSTKINKAVNYMTHLNKNVETNSMNAKVQTTAVVNKNTITTDIIKNIKYMDLNGLKEMTVKVVPKELGEIVIRLTMDNGFMKANLTASNKEAFSMLNTNIEELNSKLQNQDIKIQNFTIDIYNGDTTFFSGQSDKHELYEQNRNLFSTTKDSEDEEAVESSEMVLESNVNALA